jgi:glycosyltransferase involved in cell wall biosynthesis
METMRDFPHHGQSKKATKATTESRLRVAHLQLLPILSGVQKVSLDVLTRLSRETYEPFLICQSPGPLTEAAEAQGIRCLFADQLVRPISPYHDAIAFCQLFRLMRKYRFDIVHTHSSKTGFLGRLAAKAAGVASVTHTVHGFAASATTSKLKKVFYFGLEWLGARFCDALICLKQADLDFARRWLRVPASRLQLIPNGIATDEYQPLDADVRASVRRDVFGLTDETFAVGMVGRLSQQKNPLCFVQAADAVLAKGVNAKFFLIGDGELKDAVNAEIRRRGRAKEIVVLGWRYDVPQLIGALDLFVLTSRWEGLSLAILEALACCVAVVASDIPGNKEVIDEGVNGLLSPSEDPAGFARQIQKLLSHNALREAYGRAGRRKITTDYRLDAGVDRVVRLYSRISRADHWALSGQEEQQRAA